MELEELEETIGEFLLPEGVSSLESFTKSRDSTVLISESQENNLSIKTAA